MGSWFRKTRYLLAFGMRENFKWIFSRRIIGEIYIKLNVIARAITIQMIFNLINEAIGFEFNLR